jgi:uroporphyrin-III C-methyltransferase/precorrin-2 dehydrogenase/sirohydrochlorin ferrochelatase
VTAPLLPLFLKLEGRRVVVVGGGGMAALRVRQLAEVGARVAVVAPEIRPGLAQLAAEVHRRPFAPDDLDGAWLAVAAATRDVNREVARAAEARRVFLNAVDDPTQASAYTAGVVRRGAVTVAVSTGGVAPALAGLLREALDALLPAELQAWAEAARAERPGWKRDGLPLEARRPLLLRVLNELHDVPGAPSGAERQPPGLVSLVGAGPGDPGFLTLRGAERLRGADVVFYDALVQPALLDLAPAAHRFFVGKRAGGPSVSQRTIERLLIRAARRGQRVVRLKCGDPYVLGRGGEEALALAGAGVSFEVVPGVSSALAGPSLAGIPLTHRGLATGFAVISGHSETAYGDILDHLAPGSMSLVVLMGLGARARIATRLRSRGWAEETPTAIVLGAGSEQAFTWRGPLAGLGVAPLPADRAHLPGLIVIGEVAALSLLSTAASEAPPAGSHCPPPRLTGTR